MITSSSDLPKQHRDSPWWLFLLVATTIITPLHFLAYTAYYTEGEVMQGLFRFLAWAIFGLSCVLAFYRRTVAVALIAIAGGLLLFWQASEVRKWAMVHEDMIAFVRYADETHAERGVYPDAVESYQFNHPQTRAHIHSYDIGTDGEYRLSYFMDHSGITYWYSSDTGFGYYAD